jgi:hypothetical protein
MWVRYDDPGGENTVRFPVTIQILKNTIQNRFCMVAPIVIASQQFSTPNK